MLVLLADARRNNERVAPSVSNDAECLSWSANFNIDCKVRTLQMAMHAKMEVAHGLGHASMVHGPSVPVPGPWCPVPTPWSWSLVPDSSI